MRRSLIVLLTVLCAVVTLDAQRTRARRVRAHPPVSSSGGAYTCPATNVKTVKTSGGDFTQITSCLAQDRTCVVYAGSYNAFTMTAGSGSGNYTSVCANPGDTVTVPSLTMASHAKVIGLTVKNHASPNSARCATLPSGMDDWWISYTTMTECGSGEMVGTNNNTSGWTNGYFGHNTLSYGCSTSAAPDPCAGLIMIGVHALVENNDLSHVSDGVSNFCSFCVYRNNTMHDTIRTECNTAGNGSNCHTDFIESEPDNLVMDMHDNVYEGNVMTNNTGTDAHTFLTQADLCTAGFTCAHVIIRFNAVYNLGTYWLLDQQTGVPRVMDYNNTIVCGLASTGSGATSANGTCGNSSVDTAVASYATSTNSAVVNDVFADSFKSGSEVFYAGGTGWRHANNLAYTASCAPSCTFASPFSTETGRVTNQDPKFVNGTSNWHLQVGSPALNAGAHLTTVTSTTGSGTSFTVANADYFQDGLGLPAAFGVQADWIKVGSTTVQIASISGNTITVVSSISWTNGDTVDLYKDSSGTVVPWGTGTPHIGAFGQ